MTELDHIWSNMLDDAARGATHSGRHHVAEYLRLKAANDIVRTGACTWLLETLIEIAAEELAHQKNFKIERESGHNFIHGSSRMVGTLVRLRQGVRCLTLEAGWARTPGDGIMPGGALAFAHFTHFGMPRHSTDLRLVHAESLPRWLDEKGNPVDITYLRRHFELFLDR